MASIIKEGWLLKRGEYIKNWRPRYFVLHSDGLLLGYKENPKQHDEEPLNRFSVEKSEVEQHNTPKPFTVILRCFQWTSLVERTFAMDTEQDRVEWISAFETVRDNIKQEDVENSQEGNTDTNMGLEDFQMLKVLGKGTFGKVMLGREKRSQELFAIKLLKKTSMSSLNGAMKNFNNPFLTQLKYSFETVDRFCFVLEYANGGELFYHLSKDKVFSEERSRFYVAEILSALGYLHAINIVFRDLKLENILLDKDGHIKLADFGLCKENVSVGDTTKTFSGTPEYLAPEVLEDNDFGRAVDWWGLGVVAYEMMCGRLPFYNRDHEVLFELILSEPVKFPSRLDEKSKDLLYGLLEKDPKKRLGGGETDVQEIKQHSFFESINWQDLVEKKITPPWVPEVASSSDLKYMGMEDPADQDQMRLTPPPPSFDTDFPSVPRRYPVF